MNGLIVGSNRAEKICWTISPLFLLPTRCQLVTDWRDRYSSRAVRPKSAKDSIKIAYVTKPPRSLSGIMGTESGRIPGSYVLFWWLRLCPYGGESYLWAQTHWYKCWASTRYISVPICQSRRGLDWDHKINSRTRPWWIVITKSIRGENRGIMPTRRVLTHKQRNFQIVIGKQLRVQT